LRMDEARKNFLYNQIVSGLKFLTIDGIRYKLLFPSREVRLLAEHVYQEVINSLRFDDLMTDIQCEESLLRLGIWSPLDDESLKALEKLLEDQKVRLYKSVFDLNAQKGIVRQINGVKKSISKALSRKHFFDTATLKYHADTVKNKFMVAMSLRDGNNDPVYDEKSFWNSKSTALEQAYELRESSIITLEEYRYLARNDPWRTVWSAGKDKSLGIASADWTDEQRNVVAFSKMYDGAYQSPDCPPDPVFENDDMFDGWLIDQRRTREKEQTKQRAEAAGNWKDSAQEVFITAPTAEDAANVYDLNDMTGKMTIRERGAVIEEAGVIEDKNLPDVQRQLMVQAKDEILNRK
jgi:hypothetical protein